MVGLCGRTAVGRTSGGYGIGSGEGGQSRVYTRISGMFTQCSQFYSFFRVGSLRLYLSHGKVHTADTQARGN